MADRWSPLLSTSTHREITLSVMHRHTLILRVEEVCVCVVYACAHRKWTQTHSRRKSFSFMCLAPSSCQFDHNDPHKSPIFALSPHIFKPTIYTHLLSFSFTFRSSNILFINEQHTFGYHTSAYNNQSEFSRMKSLQMFRRFWCFFDRKRRIFSLLLYYNNVYINRSDISKLNCRSSQVRFIEHSWMTSQLQYSYVIFQANIAFDTLY